MKFTIVRSDYDGVVRFSGEVRDADLLQLRFSSFDRWLLDNCATPADCLLALEAIFRLAAARDMKVE